jgi:hypothetical protein
MMATAVTYDRVLLFLEAFLDIALTLIKVLSIEVFLKGIFTGFSL